MGGREVMRDQAASPPGLLGAVLAGGESSRYGRPKALATLAGRPMAAWAVDALKPHLTEVGLLARDPGVIAALDLPARDDLFPGQGPLGGLLTALAWARDKGLQGVFLLACDLPLVDSTLVGRILTHGFRQKDALVPASPGPLGMEPLCAAYTLACLEPAEALLASGHRSMNGLLEAVGLSLVPMDALGGAGEVAKRFTNVNTPEEGREAGERLRREVQVRTEDRADGTGNHGGTSSEKTGGPS